MKWKILLPALHRGKERSCSRRLLTKSKFQHLSVRAASSTSWTTWGLAGTRGRRSPARSSTRRPRCQFGLGRSSSGGRRGQRWMVHHTGAGCAGSPRSSAVLPGTAGQSPRRCRRTALSGRRGIEKACLDDVLHLCQVEPEMALLDHHGGHRLPEGVRAVTFVARRVKSVAERSSCTNPGSVLPFVHLFKHLDLVNLQDSHGVQCGGCLARSAISFGHLSGCQLTGLGRETRTVPPSGGVSWAQVHCFLSLHLGNARVPPGRRG